MSDSQTKVEAVICRGCFEDVTRSPANPRLICPKCRTENRPGPPTIPALTPTASTATAAKRKHHGAFFYVFWGVMSLIAAGVIILLALAFLTGFFAGVQQPVKTSSETVSSTTAEPIPPAAQEPEKAQPILKEVPRTWTFIEDGVMRSPSGGSEATWTFKKNGRLDAAFIGLEDTNVVLLAGDGTRRVIPAASLSENDRDYLKEGRGISEEQAADIKKQAVANSAESIRKSEIARMRASAETKRAAAKVELESAKRIEMSNSRKKGGQGVVTTEIYGSAKVRRDPTLAHVAAKADAERRKDAADQAKEDSTNLKSQADVKRANAAKLSREADQLEATAASMERSRVSH
jgi:hypothetical protein